MKYFVETKVKKKDGTLVVERIKAPSYEHAKTIAMLIAQDGFREQVDKYGVSFEFGLSKIYLNDYGEETEIIAMAYPDMAQVKEGKYER